MRDLRIDFFRGIALIGITWNHTVPSRSLVSEWGHFQLKTNFFFNFADVFIFISGIVCAIAFGSKISHHGWRASALAAGDRIVQIVTYNAIACCTCILIATAFGLFGVFASHHALPSGVLDSFLGSLFQYKAIPYFDILNMYVVLLAILPLFLYLYQKWRISLALSAVTYTLNQIHYYTTDNEASSYFFGSILSWQFLFFIGVTIGIEREKIMKQASKSSILMLAVSSYLFLGTYLLEMKYAYFHLTDKQYLGVFRILDILAATYLVAIFLKDKALHNIRALSPIIALGRNSLPVFALSLISCYLFSFIGELAIKSRPGYLFLLFSELTILYTTGWILSRHPAFEKIISLKFVGITFFFKQNKRNNTSSQTSQ